MADTWWRFYNTAPDHPKIFTLSDAQFRAWATMNSLASKMGGEVPGDMALIAGAMRKGVGKARELVQVLLSARLLDSTETGYRPHNWEAKQFKSDTSTSRVQKHRKQKRNGDETFHETDNETLDETDQRQRHKQRQKEESTARMARFQTFWDSCPKKTGRGAAEKAWLKATEGADPEAIIAAMRAYAGTCAGKDPAYIKTPGPWLNEKRWLDEGASAAVQFENTDKRGWESRLRLFDGNLTWLSKWGALPTDIGCKCPAEILAEWRNK